MRAAAPAPSARTPATPGHRGLVQRVGGQPHVGGVDQPASRVRWRRPRPASASR